MAKNALIYYVHNTKKGKDGMVRPMGRHFVRKLSGNAPTYCGLTDGDPMQTDNNGWVPSHRISDICLSTAQVSKNPEAELSFLYTRLEYEVFTINRDAIGACGWNFAPQAMLADLGYDVPPDYRWGYYVAASPYVFKRWGQSYGRRALATIAWNKQVRWGWDGPTVTETDVFKMMVEKGIATRPDWGMSIWSMNP